ncbi:MAG: hypothetical protein ACJA0V_004663 [Planctomycetota bacterium]
MRRPVAKQRGAVRASLVPLLACFAAGCVTTYSPIDFVGQASEMPVSQPIAIPIPAAQGGNNRLLLEFYSGILRRLQDAADDGDVALLDSLVASYDKPNIPVSVSQHLAGYRAIGRGIRFRQHAVRKAVLELRLPDGALVDGALADGALPAEPEAGSVRAGSVHAGDVGDVTVAKTVALKVPSLGNDLHLHLRLPAMAKAVTLGGRNDRNPIGFSVSVTVEDEYVDGSTRSLHTDGVVWLPERFELLGDNELLLPIDVGAASGDAVRRNVTVRVDMRGHVEIDEIRAPIKSTSIAAGSYTQWPAGFEIIAKQPLAALKVGLAAFQANNFASVYLAALKIPAPQQHEACALLMDQVRFGRDDQAQVAMAALQNVSGLSIAVGDRDSWLGWWQARAAAKPASDPAANGR